MDHILKCRSSSSVLLLVTLWSFLILIPKTYGSTPVTTLPRKINATTTPQCVVQAVATEWKKEDFPDPQVDLGRCGRNCQRSWICDPNNVLTDNYYANRIDKLLNRIRGNGICGCHGDCSGRGFKMSLALANRMKFESWETQSSKDKASRAADFANYLRSWAWHQPNTCQDDIVIFLSRGDRQVRTSVGPSAIDVITSRCVKDVYEKAKPDLTAGYFDKAIYYMIQRYEQAIVNNNCDDGESAINASNLLSDVKVSNLSVKKRLKRKKPSEGYLDLIFPHYRSHRNKKA